MKDLFIQVASGLIVLLIAGFLGLGAKTIKVMSGHSSRPTKKWKWLIIIGWIMVFGGLALFGSHSAVTKQIYPFADTGFQTALLGVIVLGIGKVGLWLTRD